jgi:FtsZ-binding cell division protein ZapB
VDSINGMSEDECKAKLATLSTYENETESAQKEDEDIVRLKEDLKETQAPYKEKLKGIKLERHLLGFRLEELGKA